MTQGAKGGGAAHTQNKGGDFSKDILSTLSLIRQMGANYSLDYMSAKNNFVSYSRFEIYWSYISRVWQIFFKPYAF